MLTLFNLSGYADFITISIESDNKLIISYVDDSISEKITFNGKMKKKFFEIYFEKKQFFIPLICSRISIDRIRIGKTKDGKLLIRNFDDHSGHILPVGGAGTSSETPYQFENQKQYCGLIPTKIGDKWGYINQADKTIIPPDFDYATIFERGNARIRIKEKWGIIDTTGKQITPVVYDWISPMDTLGYPVYRAWIERKTGILDHNGKEIVPIEYDKIDNYLIHGYAKIKLGNLYGICSRERIIVPAIYDLIYEWNENGASVKRNGKAYYIDWEGYEYEPSESVWSLKKYKPETKRKIGDENL